MYNALRLYFRREFIGRPHGGSPLSGGKNYSNVTLGKYNCLYIKLSTRTGNGGSPLQSCRGKYCVTLGKHICLYMKLSARIGNGSSPILNCTNGNNVALGHIMFFNIKLSTRIGCSDTLPAARRAGERGSPLQLNS